MKKKEVTNTANPFYVETPKRIILTNSADPDQIFLQRKAIYLTLPMKGKEIKIISRGTHLKLPINLLIQLTLAISTSLISNNCLSRTENLVPA